MNSFCPQLNEICNRVTILALCLAVPATSSQNPVITKLEQKIIEDKERHMHQEAMKDMNAFDKLTYKIENIEDEAVRVGVTGALVTAVGVGVIGYKLNKSFADMNEGNDFDLQFSDKILCIWFTVAAVIGSFLLTQVLLRQSRFTGNNLLGLFISLIPAFGAFGMGCGTLMTGRMFDLCTKQNENYFVENNADLEMFWDYDGGKMFIGGCILFGGTLFLIMFVRVISWCATSKAAPDGNAGAFYYSGQGCDGDCGNCGD